MIEYQPDVATAEARSTHTMPTAWKKPGIYQLQYQHSSCPSTTFKVTGVPLGPVLVLHGRKGLSQDVKLVLHMYLITANIIIKKGF